MEKFEFDIIRETVESLVFFWVEKYNPVTKKVKYVASFDNNSTWVSKESFEKQLIEGNIRFKIKTKKDKIYNFDYNLYIKLYDKLWNTPD